MSLRIVFMGTPDFAVASLKALVENKYNVVGVITMPDKPAGRGHKMQHSAVKEYALEQGLPLLQPEKLKDQDFIDALRAWNADLQIVVAFRMLPEIVWNMPRLGTFNLHASLLPQYRGAAPINWAVINGDKETGVTTFMLTHEIDTGAVMLQEKIEIAETDNAGIVHDKLMTIGAGVVCRTVDLIASGKVDLTDQIQMIQSEISLKPAPKIFRETCALNTDMSVENAYNFVRGMAPHPGAWMEVLLPGHSEKIILKIFEVEKLFVRTSQDPGTVILDPGKSIRIALKDGYVVLKQIQAPGKKRMAAEEWLRGMR